MDQNTAEVIAEDPTHPVEGDKSPLGREVAVTHATWVWLVVLFAGLAGVGIRQQRVDSYQAFNADRYVVATVLVAVVALVLWIVVRFVFKATMLQATAGVAVFVLLFFGWHYFLRFTLELGVSGFFGDLLLVGLFASSTAALLMRPRRSVVLGGALLLSVGGLLAAAAPYVSWTLIEPRPIEFVSVGTEARATDDVLIVVLDAYLRADRLAELMEFDNSGFAVELEKRGFLVDEDAMSNYNRSYGSVASMMALQPPLREGVMQPEDDELMRSLLGGAGPLFGIFRETGYEVTSYLNGWKGSRCTSAVDYCIRRGIVGSTAWYLTELTPLAPLLRSSPRRPETTVAIEQIANLGSDVIEAFDRERPQLVWSHVSLPHPPLVLDAGCNQRNEFWRSGTLLKYLDFDLGPRVKAYTEQIECVNRLVLEQLDEIIAAYPDSRIVLVSDHGPNSREDPSAIGDWSDVELAEMFSIITAVRAPRQCDDIVDSLTVVNMLRRFVSCTVGGDIAPTDDGQYVLPSSANPSDVYRVTAPQR
jgi:hypothetical protein